ncbi:MAG: hypothetical protein ACRC6T_05380 [Sarcina sp.]
MKEKGLELYWNEFINLYELEIAYERLGWEDKIPEIDRRKEIAKQNYIECLKRAQKGELLYLGQNVKLIENKYSPINEEFIERYKKIVVAVSKRYSINHKDVEEDILYFILQAFHSYENQETKFTTWLWQVVQQNYINKINTSKTKKNDSGSFKHISLDIESDSDINPRDSFGVEDNEIYNLYEKDFIEFIISNLDDFEIDLLQANLKVIQFKDICIKYNLKKNTLSNRNSKFKEKLESLIWKYNS